MHHGLCCVPSLQLILPEGTLPRWGHTVTFSQLDEETVKTTTFGGCPANLSGLYDNDPKLADTTVMEFGEQKSAVYTMFLAEIRKEGGWGRCDPVGRHYLNMLSLKTLTCNHS